MSELPATWALADLGDVLPIRYGKALAASARQDRGEYRVFGSNGVVGNHAEALTTGPSIVVGRKGAAGAVHYAAEPCWVIDTAYFTESTDVFELKFASYLLSAMSLGRLDRSTAIPSLSRDDYSSVQVPVAPRSEQRRIVEKLEELLSDLDAGIAALERARANLTRYRAAVLKAAVEGRLTEKWRAAHPDAEPAGKLLERILAERRKKWERAQLKKYAEKGQAPAKGWKDKYVEPAKPDVATLSELPNDWCWAALSQLGELDRGKSKHRPRNAAHLYGGSHPFIQTGDIKEAGTFLNTYVQTYSDAGLKQSKLWPAGTLCITIAANIAETTILGIDACFPDSVVGFVPSESISVRYIQLQLQAVRKRIEAMAPATAQKNINLEVLYRVPIALPPELEQKRIVDEVEAIRSVEEQSEVGCRVGLTRSSMLRQSILKRAFEGKLVPQEPKDEPASELLARIRAEREAGKGGQKHAGPKRQARQNIRQRR